MVVYYHYYNYYFLAIFIVKLVSTFKILHGINDISAQDESNSKGKLVEFWPSFDEEPVKIADIQVTVKPIPIGGTQVMYPTNVLDDTTSSTKILYFWQTTTTPALISSTFSTKILSLDVTNLTVETPTSTLKNYIPNHSQESIKRIDEIYGKQNLGYQPYDYYPTLHYSRGIMYNVIIVILGTIGIACILAIAFGFVVIGRVSRCTNCICHRNKENNNNNNNNINNNNNSGHNNNNNDNMNNFRSSNTMVSFYGKRDGLSSKNSLPEIMNSASQTDLADPIIVKHDESIIYSTTSITDTSETKTISKLCNSGVLTLENLDNVSPYAAISIDDIKSPNIKNLPNVILEDLNENSSADCDVNEGVTSADFNNYHQEERSKTISESNSINSEANKESVSDKNTLPSSDFDANFMKNLSNNAFSSTNTIGNTTTPLNSNTNSTFYSLRIDRPVKPNHLKMNSYRAQDLGKQSR